MSQAEAGAIEVVRLQAHADPFINRDAYLLARDFMDPRNETYNATHNGPGEFGQYGFFPHNPSDGSGVGTVYDFPFAENTGLSGRMSRLYVDWLDGMIEIAGSRPYADLKETTAFWLAHLVSVRRMDPPGVAL